MDDDANAWMLGAHVFDVANGKSGMDRAMALPKNHSRARNRVRVEAAPDFVGIPDDHLVERHAELVRGVAAKMLIGQKENPIAPLPGPLQRCRGIRRSTDDAVAFAAKGFDRG